MRVACCLLFVGSAIACACLLEYMFVVEDGGVHWLSWLLSSCMFVHCHTRLLIEMVVPVIYCGFCYRVCWGVAMRACLLWCTLIDEDCFGHWLLMMLLSCVLGCCHACLSVMVHAY